MTEAGLRLFLSSLRSCVSLQCVADSVSNEVRKSERVRNR